MCPICGDIPQHPYHLTSFPACEMLYIRVLQEQQVDLAWYSHHQ
jgi:hypothetical protein